MPTFLIAFRIRHASCTSISTEFFSLPPRGPDPWRSDSYEASAISVDGGNFTSRCTQNGAFLFAGDRARANITGGLMEGNVADK